MSTKTVVSLFASAPVTPGGNKNAPAAGGAGAGVLVTLYEGGTVTYKITNGSSAPGVATKATLQTSTDNSAGSWRDVQQVGSENAASQVYTGSIAVGKGDCFYLRWLVYDNTVNAITFESTFQAIS